MKKFLLFTLFIILITQCIFPFSSVTAKGESNNTYACVLSSDVYLYQDVNENSGLFILPYTYYVKVLTTGAPYCYVQYLEDSSTTKAICGYCKTSQLTFVEYTPQRPFLYYPLQVKYTLDESYPSISNTLLTSIEVPCSYYGDYKIGSALYCYVYMEGKFGYIPKTESINYEQNTDCFSSNTPIQEENKEVKNNQWKNIVPVTIIFILCIVLLTIFCFALKGKQPPIEKEE